MLNPFMESEITSAVYSVIGSGVIVAGILLIRKLAMGKITRNLQYSLWGILPAYLFFSSFFSIDIPIHNMPFDAFMDLGQESAIEAADPAARQIASFKEQDAALSIPASNAYEASAPVSHGNSGSSENKHAPVQNQNHNTSAQKMTLHINKSWNIVRLLVTLLLLALFAISNIVFALRLTKKRQFYKKDKQTGMNIYLVQSPNTPFLFGRNIYLPPAAPGNQEQMRYMVLHEFCHFKQGDLFWNFLKYICLALYWFHPFVWLAAHYISRDCELACDEAVIRMVGRENRQEYGLTLLQLIKEKQKDTGFTIGTTMKGHKSMIKERIQLLSKPFPKNKKSALLCLASLLLLTGCALVRPYAADQTADTVENSQPTTKIASKENEENPAMPRETPSSDVITSNVITSDVIKNHYYNPVKYADGILYYQTADALQGMNMKTGEISLLASGNIRLGTVSDHFLYYLKTPTASGNAETPSNNTPAASADEAGIYRINLSSQAEELLIPWTDELRDCTSMLIKDDCLYLEMDKSCQAYLMKDGQTARLEDPDNQIQHAISLFDIAADNTYRMNYGFIHSIADYSTFTLVNSQNHRLYICNTQSQEILEKENCLGDVIICDAGIVYQTMDFDIVLNPWTDLEEDRILFSSEKAGYVLNYGTCNDAGLFAFRENGDSAECKYITWDGKMQDLMQIPGVRLSIDLHFSAFSDFVAYYNNGKICVEQLAD